MSKFTDQLKAIKSKNFELWRCISEKSILVSPAVAELLANLLDEELATLVNAIPSDYYPCRISIARNAIGSDSANIAIRALNKPGSRAVFPFMPIKRTPTYNPDAEIEGLAYTIPVWTESIRQKCSEIDFGQTSDEARLKLLRALAELDNTAAKFISVITSIGD